MSKDDWGTLYTISWFNPYTEPPEEAPRVLAEMFVIGHQHGQCPKAIDEFPLSPGGGYSIRIQHVGKPGKTLPPETLAVIRKKRITRRVTAKVPMFAEHFVQEEISKKKSYYDGLTDPRLKDAADQANALAWARYEELMSRPGVLVVYAQEPAACKELAVRLRADVEAMKSG
jgi:hypothetical protein